MRKDHHCPAGSQGIDLTLRGGKDSKHLLRKGAESKAAASSVDKVSVSLSQWLSH